MKTNESIYKRVYTLYIQEDKNMDYKVIDCKIKEIYFNAKPIEEDEAIVESRSLFWNSLKNLAVQNISIQQLKMA